jgi:hypothetical protein
VLAAAVLLLPPTNRMYACPPTVHRNGVRRHVKPAAVMCAYNRKMTLCFWWLSGPAGPLKGGTGSLDSFGQVGQPWNLVIKLESLFLISQVLASRATEVN